MKYFSAIKRKKLLIHKTIWMNLKCFKIIEKKPDSKGYILYVSIHLTFMKRQNKH